MPTSAKHCEALRSIAEHCEALRSFEAHRVAARLRLMTTAMAIWTKTSLSWQFEEPSSSDCLISSGSDVQNKKCMARSLRLLTSQFHPQKGAIGRDEGGASAKFLRKVF